MKRKVNRLPKGAIFVCTNLDGSQEFVNRSRTRRYFVTRCKFYNHTYSVIYSEPYE